MKIALIALSVCIASVYSQRQCAPPTRPPGSRWVSKNCGNTGFYRDSATNEKCHCWGKCGYICQPDSGKSPCDKGGVYFNDQGERCRCNTKYGQSSYICEATTTTPSSGGSDTTTAAGETTTGSTGTTAAPVETTAAGTSSAGQTTAAGTTAAGQTTVATTTAATTATSGSSDSGSGATEATSAAAGESTAPP